MYQKSGVNIVKVPSAPIELAEQTYKSGSFAAEDIVTQESSN
jgi:hypothetical protein